jgi:long-chain acyl-CoA synthetase
MIMDAAAPVPRDLVLSSFLAAAIARHGARPAMLYEGRRWTYAALGRQVRAAAAGLRALGVAPGGRVGLCLPNTPYSVVLFYAVLEAGAVVVNYNPLYTAPELRKQLMDSETDTLIVPDLAAIHDKAATLLDGTTLRRLVVCSMADARPLARRIGLLMFRRRLLARPRWSDRVVSYTSMMARGRRLLRRGGFQPAAPAPGDLAVLQYTGGTTGVPKAAMLSHGNLAINARQVIDHMPSLRPGQERILGVLPFFHVFAMTSVLNSGVALGAEIQLHTRFDLKAMMRALPRDRPTVLHAVPTIYAAIATAAEQGGVDISSIRACISGGAPLPEEVRLRFERLTHARLIEGYGLTEASPVVTCNSPDGAVRPGSVGVPLAWTTVEICALDEPARLLPRGERGEICVRGPQVMTGYLGRAQETADCFIDGALRTGDIGYLDTDGYLYVTDRLKDLIICGGYNVYPRVIEEALYQHEAVAEAVAVGVPDAYRGEAPVAFVSLRQGASTTPEALATFLRAQLSPIEQPKRIEIRPSLPKTAVGKLSRKELRAECVDTT